MLVGDLIRFKMVVSPDKANLLFMGISATRLMGVNITDVIELCAFTVKL